MKNEEKNKRIDSPATSSLDIIKDVFKVIQKIGNDAITAKQGSIEEYMETKSQELDKAITNLEKNDYSKYIAGEISAIHDGGGNFHLEGDFYFKNKTNEIINHKIIGKSIKMDWILTPEEQHRLVKENKITYDYEKP